MRTILLALFGVLFWSATAAAQAPISPAPISYELKVFNQGARDPITTASLLPAGFACNQPWPDTSNTANPNKIAMDDPAFPLSPSTDARACVYVDAGGGPLLSLPFGSGAYVATLAAVNIAGLSPASTPSPPFTRPGTVVDAPTGVRVYR